MKGYWVKLDDGSEGYCEGGSEYDAAKIAEHMTGKKVNGGPFRDFDMKPLPYPANPVIWQFEHPIHGKTPKFCFSPHKCAGATSCPNKHSCTE